MPDTLPPPLQTLVGRYANDIDGLMSALESGQLTLDDWQGEFEAMIARYQAAALMRGQGETVLSEPVRALLEGLVAVQLVFAGNFARVMRAAGAQMGEMMQGFRARAQLYSLAVKTAYQHGDIIRELGWLPPLPYMPAQGTQCTTRCNCGWRFANNDPETKSVDAYWTLDFKGTSEKHCQTCEVRSKLSNPARIRNGVLLSP